MSAGPLSNMLVDNNPLSQLDNRRIEDYNFKGNSSILDFSSPLFQVPNQLGQVYSHQLSIKYILEGGDSLMEFYGIDKNSLNPHIDVLKVFGVDHEAVIWIMKFYCIKNSTPMINSGGQVPSEAIQELIVRLDSLNFIQTIPLLSFYNINVNNITEALDSIKNYFKNHFTLQVRTVQGLYAYCLIIEMKVDSLNTFNTELSKKLTSTDTNRKPPQPINILHNVEAPQANFPMDSPGNTSVEWVHEGTKSPKFSLILEDLRASSDEILDEHLEFFHIPADDPLIKD